MSKRVSILLVLFFWTGLSYSQNRFVYVWYNPTHGNASAIVGAIDEMIEKDQGRVVVFVSQASSPIIATNNTEWEEVRSGLLRMQTSYEYYAEDEATLLNDYFATLFIETVDRDLHIKGAEDKVWSCTFIISETMLHSEEFETLAETISVNELTTRMAVNVLTYNDSQRLSLAEIPANTMFNFNTTK